MESAKVYVVEPRNEDGSYNVKGKEFYKVAPTGKEIFDYYFLHNKGCESAVMEEIVAWYKKQGWSIRIKNW